MTLERSIYSGIIEELSSEIERILERETICGLSIAIVDDKKTLWAKGFGHTDINKKEYNIHPKNSITPQKETRVFPTINLNNLFILQRINFQFFPNLVEQNSLQYLPLKNCDLEQSPYPNTRFLLVNNKL